VSLFDRVLVRTLPAVPRPVVKRLSERYIAGAELADACRVVKELNERGRVGTIDVLGEEIHTREEARALVEEYEDVFETIREQLLRQEIAVAAGKADALSDAGLQARYEATKGSVTDVAMGYIAVPDQATADATLARLTASPADYPAVAAQFAGRFTLPEIEVRSADQIPGVLAEGVAAAAPNTGFTTPVPEAGGIVVTFVQGAPSFEQLRDQLEQQAMVEVDQAGAELVSEVRDDLGVRLNPRYAEHEDGEGVVDFLDDEETPAG